MHKSKAIQQLIRACIDDERMLWHESRKLGGERQLVLEQLARQRHGFIESLHALGGDLSPPPLEPRGSLVEIAREAGRTIRAAIGGEHAGDCIAACRRSNRRTEDRFDEALGLPLYANTRELLEEQRELLGQDHEELIAIQF